MIACEQEGVCAQQFGSLSRILCGDHVKSNIRACVMMAEFHILYLKSFTGSWGGAACRWAMFRAWAS